MVTQELVQAELQRLNADDLSKVYGYIKQVEQEKPETGKAQSLLDGASPVESRATRQANDWDLRELHPQDEAWAYFWLCR